MSTVVKSKCQTCKEFAGPCAIFLLFGIANAVVLKLAFVTEAEGLEQYGLHSFQKPWFLTTICFISMALVALPWYGCLLRWSKNRDSDPRLKPWSSISFKEYCEFAIPAFSDSFEGIVSAVCIVFVGVSIDSMMKSGTLVGVSLIAKFIFHQSKPAYQWASIVLVVIALTMVGAAGIINADSSTTIRTSKIWVAVIIVLKFISQVGYSVKISYEEYFTQRKTYHPILVVGMTGLWSTIMCGGILMPIAQFMPGEEGNGIHEDTLDTFAQIGNSTLVLVIVIISFFLGFSYNIASVSLIGATSAIVRTLMEAFRTFLIWMIQFMIFYGFRTSKELYLYRLVGEEWGLGSYVQLAGFVLMTFALLAYNGFPKYPCFTYEDAEDKEEKDEEMDAKIKDGLIESNNYLEKKIQEIENAEDDSIGVIASDSSNNEEHKSSSASEENIPVLP